jgi:hypothetical protein
MANLSFSWMQAYFAPCDPHGLTESCSFGFFVGLGSVL